MHGENGENGGNLVREVVLNVESQSLSRLPSLLKASENSRWCGYRRVRKRGSCGVQRAAVSGARHADMSWAQYRPLASGRPAHLIVGRRLDLGPPS